MTEDFKRDASEFSNLVETIFNSEAKKLIQKYPNTSFNIELDPIYGLKVKSILDVSILSKF